MTEHPEKTFYLIDRALKEFFTPDVFLTGLVQEDLIYITSLPVIIVGLLIHQPIREAPLNYNISRASTSYAVEAVMGEVDFGPLSHNATMMPGQTYGRAHKAEIYIAHYMEATS